MDAELLQQINDEIDRTIDSLSSDSVTVNETGALTFPGGDVNDIVNNNKSDQLINLYTQVSEIENNEATKTTKQTKQACSSRRSSSIKKRLMNSINKHIYKNLQSLFKNNCEVDDTLVPSTVKYHTDNLQESTFPASSLEIFPHHEPQVQLSLRQVKQECSEIASQCTKLCDNDLTTPPSPGL